MLVKIFQVATFALVAWLIFQSGQLDKQLGLQTRLLQLQSVAAAEPVADVPTEAPVLAEINTRLDGLLKQQGEQSKAKQQLQAFQDKQSKLDMLRKAYILVLEAETERGHKNAQAAIEKLKASKSLIWKSGTHYPDQKKALQGLMKNIDMTAGAWAAGKLDKDAKAIYSVLKQSLSKQGQ